MTRTVPQAAEEPVWVYAPAQYELALLHRLVEEGFAANRNVHYARNHGDLAPVGEFLCEDLPALLEGRGTVLAVRATGEVTASADGAPVPVRRTGELHELDLPAGASSLQLTVRPGRGVPAAIGVRAGTWRTRLPGEEHWRRTAPREVASTAPPHEGPLAPTVRVRPVREGDLWVLPATVLGRPLLTALPGTVPTLLTGETRAEASDTDVAHESRHDLVHLGGDLWTSRHALGFAVLRATGVRDVEVEVSSHALPDAPAAPFRSADAQLQTIADVATRTLRTCMHGLMLDGVKRDRMPWVGDQSLSALANAAGCGDARIAYDSLIALGRPRDGYVNGIVDYSLWWLITARLLPQQLGAPTDPAAHARDAEALARTLLPVTAADGTLRPGPGPGGEGPPSVLIDWGVEADPVRLPTALQVLWFWALSSLVELLEEQGMPAGSWRDLAESVRSTLYERAWDPERTRWRDHLVDPSGWSPHADFLGILAGIDRGEASLRPELGRGHVDRAGTPFMTSYAILALIETGRQELALAMIRELWGAMLEASATTFWEDFADDESWAMYGRRYGRSLCHAWASGPAFLLPRLLLGLRPLADGWSRVAVDPCLLDVESADASVPTPHGPLRVGARGDQVSLEVPPGVTVVVGAEERIGPFAGAVDLRPVPPERR